MRIRIKIEKIMMIVKTKGDRDIGTKENPKREIEMIFPIGVFFSTYICHDR